MIRAKREEDKLRGKTGAPADDAIVKASAYAYVRTLITRVYFVTLTHFEIIDMTAMPFITATVYGTRCASSTPASELDAMSLGNHVLNDEGIHIRAAKYRAWRKNSKSVTIELTNDSLESEKLIVASSAMYRLKFASQTNVQLDSGPDSLSALCDIHLRLQHGSIYAVVTAREPRIYTLRIYADS